MEQITRALKGRGHRAFIAHVADHRLAMQAGDVDTRGVCPHQHTHMQAALDQGAGDGGTNEPGCSRHKRNITHVICAPRNAARPSTLCQYKSAGTPSTISRARLRSDTATP